MDYPTKTYHNDIYTKTVEVIKTSPKCIELGYKLNVKVTIVYKDWLNNGCKHIKTVEWYMTNLDYLQYKDGYRYYKKEYYKK